jgi:hypothetical protein
VIAGRTCGVLQQGQTSCTLHSVLQNGMASPRIHGQHGTMQKMALKLYIHAYFAIKNEAI